MNYQKLLLTLFLIVALVVPGWVFYSARGAEFFIGEPSQTMRALFPVFGLYAFTLIWIQTMIGIFMRKLIRIYPGIYRFHRAEGIFTFIFIWIHPTLLYLSLNLNIFKLEFLNFYKVAELYFGNPNFARYLMLGEAALLIITTTVLTALFHRHKLLLRHWRKIHLLNYLVVPLTFIHSKTIGTDVQTPPLSYLWWFYILSFTGAILYRLFLRQSASPVVREGESHVS